MRPSPSLDTRRLDLEFHGLIWRLTGNEYLEKYLSNLTKPVYAQYVSSLSAEEKRRKVLNSHRPLLDFIPVVAELGAGR